MGSDKARKPRIPLCNLSQQPSSTPVPTGASPGPHPFHRLCPLNLDPWGPALLPAHTPNFPETSRQNPDSLRALSPSKNLGPPFPFSTRPPASRGQKRENRSKDGYRARPTPAGRATWPRLIVSIREKVTELKLAPRHPWGPGSPCT